MSMESIVPKTEVEQMVLLEKVLSSDPTINNILHSAQDLHLPNWYLGASCVAQQVWNYVSGTKPNYKSDYDLVYFDEDLNREKEVKNLRRAKRLFRPLEADIELTNEAKVHMWYEEEFGKKILPYTSTEDAISTWPTTASSIGVRYDNNGEFVVCAPFGLDDLFSMVLRPNKKLVTEEVYQRKVDKWTKNWPDLKVIPW